MGLVSPSQSNSGDEITAASINNPVNQLATVINGNVDNTNLATGAVTTIKLADGAVTSGKLGSGSVVRLGLNIKTTTGTLIPATYTTFCTVTASSSGGEVELDYRAVVVDGNSGGARSGHIRVQCDGTTVASSDITWQTAASTARANPSMIINHTPASGSHAWTLQLLADTANATTVDQASLRVTEVKP